MQPLVVQPKQVGIVLKDHRDSAIFNKDVIGSCAGLLVRCGPSAIVWFIVAVRVLSIQRVAGWAWPHVLEKLGRIFRPRRAHFYTAPTVLRVLLIMWVLAPAFCAVIGLQFPALASANAMPMRDGSSGRNFLAQTPARLDAAASYSVKFYSFFDPTDTPEPPVRVPPRGLFSVERSKAAVSLSRDV